MLVNIIQKVLISNDMWYMQCHHLYCC